MEINNFQISMCVALIVVILLVVYWGGQSKVEESFVADVRGRDDVDLNERTNAVTEDYSERMQNEALEESVFASHNEYTRDMDRLTSGPSALSERTDDVNLVPFVGLRRPDYDSVRIDPAARQIPSVYPEQMGSRTSYDSSGLF